MQTCKEILTIKFYYILLKNLTIIRIFYFVKFSDFTQGAPHIN
jgi:hypothetical protein